MRLRKREPAAPLVDDEPVEKTIYYLVAESFAWRGHVFARGQRVEADDPLVEEICQHGGANAFYRDAI